MNPLTWRKNRPPIPTGGGDPKFSDIAPAEDHNDGARYVFRAWRVTVNAHRKHITRPNKEPLKGVWQLDDNPHNGKLTGVFRSDYIYGPGINVARCATQHILDNYTPHRAPFILPNGTPHGCGFYGYAATDHPDAAPPHNRYVGQISIHVQGVARFTGRRINGTLGSVAEKCEIVALLFPLQFNHGTLNERDAFDVFTPKLERLITTHYPNVAVFTNVRAMVAEYPLTPPAQHPPGDDPPVVAV